MHLLPKPATPPSRVARRTVLFLLVALSPLSCSGTRFQPAKDPMKCERDPNCASRQDKSKDCITACADDIACIDRCRQVTGQK